MKKRILILGAFLIAGGLILVTSTKFWDNPGHQAKHDIVKKSQESESIEGAIEYMRLLKADLNTGVIDPERVKQAYSQLNRMPQYRSGLSLTWEFAGPDNVGGRSRALVIDKDNPNILYAGGVSGGIFKSEDGGQHWRKISYEAVLGGLSISCMTQASNGDLYAGTGELFFTAMSGPNGNLTSGSIGGGVYKSTDRGETWTLLSNTDPTKTGNSAWQNVQDIVVDPNNPQIVYAGSSLGLMKSEDGGNTWNRITLPGSYISSTIIDIEISPDGKTIFVAGYKGFQCQLFRSINGGDFERVGKDQVSANLSRMTIAIAPSNPDYVYLACVSNGSGGYQAYSTEGIYRSTDNGDTWTKIVDGNSSAEVFGTQGQYDNCIAVDPDNENRVFVGGVDLYCWKNGFWYKIASTSEFADADRQFFNPFYVHADKHIIRFDTRSNPAKMFIGTDGGFHVSTDYKNKYPTYRSINLNYTTTQFYAIAANFEGYVLGGTQDQGSMIIEKDGLTGKSAWEVLGGDGFYCEFSKYVKDVFFVESQYGSIYRTKDLGKNMESFASDLNIPESSTNFNTPFRLWEAQFDSTFYDDQGKPFDSTVTLGRLFVAFYSSNASQSGVWMSPHAIDFITDTIKWYKLGTITSFRPMCMEYTDDGNTLFVGGTSGSTGRLYRISGIRNAVYKHDASGNFDPEANGIKTELIASFAGRSVTGIGVSPSRKNTIVVALGNYSSSADHIYICNNALDSIPKFTSIQGNLPVMPVYDAAIHSLSSSQDTIIIATEFGMFSTVNGGNTWIEENNGIGRGPVFMIRQLRKPWHKGFILYAGSHGQGIFRTSTLVPNVSVDESPLKPIKISVFPNPAVHYSTVTLASSENKKVKLSIYHLNGQLVYIKELTIHTGQNRISIPVSDWKAGNYIVRVDAPEQTQVSKFIVIH